jgi:hypothetical protein
MVLSLCLGGVQLEGDQCACLIFNPSRHAARIFTSLFFDDHDLVFFSYMVFSLKGISARISEFSLRGMLRIIFTLFISYFMVLPFCLGGVQLEGDQCAHL